jgi:hypothetical protein
VHLLVMSNGTVTANVNLPPTTWYVSLASKDNLGSNAASLSPRRTEEGGAGAETTAAAALKSVQSMLVAAPNGTVIGVYAAQAAPCLGKGPVLACRYLAMPKSSRPADCEQTLSDDELNAIISHCETRLHSIPLHSATKTCSCDKACSDDVNLALGDAGEVRMLSISDVATGPSLAHLRPSSNCSRRARS